MLAMGPRDLNSAPYSPVHCSSHSMTSFQSSELTELPVVENSQLFAQRAHSVRTAHGTTPHTNGRQWRTSNSVEVPCFMDCLPGAFASSVVYLPEGPTILHSWFRAKGSASIALHTEHAPDVLVDASFANVPHPQYRPGSGGLKCPLQPPKKPQLQRSSFHPNKGIGHCCQWHMTALLGHSLLQSFYTSPASTHRAPAPRAPHVRHSQKTFYRTCAHSKGTE